MSMTKESQAPYQKIKNAAKITGLSMYYLRNGCKAGIIPHVKSGTTYFINVPALLRQLESGGEPPHAMPVQIRPIFERLS